ncbi:unnamed protein product [Musa textilis]
MAASSTAAGNHPEKRKKEPKLLLGRFEVGKLLGAGTFAKVYVARNISTDELVAIKALDKEKIIKCGLVAHIKREIAILRRVRHPYIVQLFEVMATKTKIYFVMEYVRGGELFSRVAKGRLREDTARRYFQQLISAVAFCHARGVFHRDLKPENLLVDENGDLKVSDFGLSAVAEQSRGGDGLLHTLCGTPAYVAPEVLSRRGYDGAKVDIWSCGVILFVLMAGYLRSKTKISSRCTERSTRAISGARGGSRRTSSGFYTAFLTPIRGPGSPSRRSWRISGSRKASATSNSIRMTTNYIPRTIPNSRPTMYSRAMRHPCGKPTPTVRLSPAPQHRPLRSGCGRCQGLQVSMRSISSPSPGGLTSQDCSKRPERRPGSSPRSLYQRSYQSWRRSPKW